MSEEKSILKTWGRLLRLPNLFTVPGDAAAGALLAVGLAGLNSILWSGTAVIMLYMAGLLLNDYFDREEDALERPDRPIPAGDVSPILVFAAAWALIIGAIALAWFAGGGPAGIAACGVAVCVVLYDAGLRKVPGLGLLLMGMCRGGSVMIGGVCAGRLSVGVYIAAAAATLYTISVTLVAADETMDRPPGRKVYIPAFVALSFAFVGPLLSGGRVGVTVTLFLPAIAFIAAFWEAVCAGHRVAEGNLAVPPFIGRLIRIMLTLQAAWVLCALTGGTIQVSVCACAIFAALRFAADAASKRFYGS